MAFDLPTQMGRDADHARARGEVGKVGVSISSLEDMEVLLDGHPAGRGLHLDDHQRHGAHPARASTRRWASRTGVPPEQLSGTVQNDILKEYMARGTYIYPPEPSLRLITDMFAFCAKRGPKWNPISISGYHIREAGSTRGPGDRPSRSPTASPTWRRRSRRGSRWTSSRRRLSFFFNVHNNFLEEVAKFRAARRLWARIMKERFEAKDPRSMMLRFHAQTAGCTLTAQQPDNNVVRVALQALAAVLGGAQSLHTNCRDEALALPTEEAARLALRTQQVIAYESGVADIIDPLGGSYARGGADRRAGGQGRRTTSAGSTTWAAWCAPSPRATRSGEIQEAAYEAQRDMEEKRSVVVGVNQFQVRGAAARGAARAWTRPWSACRPSG